MLRPHFPNFTTIRATPYSMQRSVVGVVGIVGVVGVADVAVVIGAVRVAGVVSVAGAVDVCRCCRLCVVGIRVWCVSVCLRVFCV